MNEVIHYFQTENVREMNNLLKAAANVRSKLVGCKRKTRRENRRNHGGSADWRVRWKI